MIIKKLENGTYIFNKENGITAFFSQKEEKILYTYFENGERNQFIERLYDLGIITKYEKIIKNKNDIFLQSIHIDITDSCPLKCSQCYKSDNLEKFMNIDFFKTIIDEAEKLNCFQIAIGGGEPLVHKDIVEMVRYVGNTNMSVSITSSGFNLDVDMLEKLKKAGLNHIQISLNGSTDAINSLSRDGFVHGINGLKLLSKDNVSFGINFVVRRDNIDDLKNIIELGKSLGVENINLLRYKPTKLEDYESKELGEEHIKKLLQIVKNNVDVNIKVDSAFTPFLMLANNGKVSKNQSGCGALINFINITVDGNFKPCSHIDLEEYASSIASYYMNSHNKKALTSLEYIEEASCIECDFNKECFGCLAITQYKCGKILKGEKDCKCVRGNENV